jgi:hypothetical protein
MMVEEGKVMKNNMKLEGQKGEEGRKVRDEVVVED